MNYAPGYFTEFITANDWPPRFKSSIKVDKRTGRFETSYAESMRLRAAGGWDRHTITQPGSVQYVQAGPVEMMNMKRKPL